MPEPSESTGFRSPWKPINMRALRVGVYMASHSDLDSSVPASNLYMATRYDHAAAMWYGVPSIYKKG